MADGSSVGNSDGSSVGDTENIVDGKILGSKVGSFDCLSVGERVTALIVGAIDGSSDGYCEGAIVGSDDSSIV